MDNLNSRLLAIADDISRAGIAQEKAKILCADLEDNFFARLDPDSDEADNAMILFFIIGLASLMKCAWII